MGRKAKPKVSDQKLCHLKVIRKVLDFRSQITPAECHGNTKLHFADALVAMLAAFFNPTLRSLRLVEQLSQIPWVNRELSIDRVCRSTLSGAFERFSPEQLIPLIQQLMKEIPQLAKHDPDLKDVCQQVVAVDGSLFTLAGEVAWALRQKKSNGRPLSQPRLDLHLDINTFTPVGLSVAGKEDESEAAELLKRIDPGVIYLLDRYYIHFSLLEKILSSQSDVVLRLRMDINFTQTKKLELTQRDKDAGVVSDSVGVLPGSGGRPGGISRTTAPPARLMREVIVVNQETGETVRLLTSLLDVPAYVIGALYKNRWVIELFFRWLKVLTGFEHLMSASRQGVTMELYVALIGCLLLRIHTGMTVNKYTVFLIGQVACGQLESKLAMEMLHRIAREKSNEKARLLRKKLAAKKV